MYWGDAQLNKIEKANLDGTGRTVLLTETTTDVRYFAFVLDAGSLYYTDWTYVYGEYTLYFIADAYVILCQIPHKLTYDCLIPAVYLKREIHEIHSLNSESYEMYCLKVQPTKSIVRYQGKLVKSKL